MRTLLLVAAGLALAAVVGSGAVLWLQGYRAYVVHTGSMSPSSRRPGHRPVAVVVPRG
jgi:hypothetical protein